MSKSVQDAARRGKASSNKYPGGQTHRGYVALLWAPVLPTALFPKGWPGQVRITGHTKAGPVVKTYRLTCHSAKGVLEGWRLQPEGEGQTYDLPRDLGSCECPHQLKTGAACKHILALRALLNRGLLPEGVFDVQG